MRDPKITTKSAGWVGWKSCHQPFLQRVSYRTVSLSDTSHITGRQGGEAEAHIWPQQISCMLMRFMLAKCLLIVLDDCLPSYHTGAHIVWIFKKKIILKSANVSTTFGDHFVFFLSAGTKGERPEVLCLSETLQRVGWTVVFRLYSEQADHLSPAMKVATVKT